MVCMYVIAGRQESATQVSLGLIGMVERRTRWLWVNLPLLLKRYTLEKGYQEARYVCNGDDNSAPTSISLS